MRCRRVLAFLLALAGASAAARRCEADDEGARLVFSGEALCREGDLRKMMTRTLGDDPFQPQGRTAARVAVSRQKNGLLVAAIAREEAGPPRRTKTLDSLSAGTCEDLIRGIATVLRQEFGWSLKAPPRPPPESLEPQGPLRPLGPPICMRQPLDDGSAPILEYEPGGPIPRGYVERVAPVTWPKVAGLIAFLWGYGVSATFIALPDAAISGNGNGTGRFQTLWIPLAGPFIALGAARPNAGEAFGLANAGVLQVAGAAALLAGFLVKRRHLEPEKGRVRAAAMLAPGSAGVSVRATF